MRPEGDPPPTSHTAESSDETAALATADHRNLRRHLTYGAGHSQRKTRMGPYRVQSLVQGTWFLELRAVLKMPLKRAYALLFIKAL